MRLEIKQISEHESIVVNDTTSRTLKDIYEALNDYSQPFIMLGDQIYQKSIIEYVKGV
ncbi:hypothetical protein N7O58_03210 [Enterococcus dispar]|uniref:hypothetical protein n=1 Tax=Enterococcus dispar TaxID=44009 RepID=UPI0021D43E6E|nr:hypothetical protein [Enterococcus dispar]MCU7356689.1 hypothetical protein [Enterococcus dispar]